MTKEEEEGGGWGGGVQCSSGLMIYSTRFFEITSGREGKNGGERPNGKTEDLKQILQRLSLVYRTCTMSSGDT